MYLAQPDIFCGKLTGLVDEDKATLLFILTLARLLALFPKILKTKW